MQINKVLIFNPFGIGDVLFSMPLMRNFKVRITGSPSVCRDMKINIGFIQKRQLTHLKAFSEA